MCLVADLDLTREWRDRLVASGGAITFYKTLLPLEGDLTSRGGFAWRPRWNVAEGELPERIEEGTVVHGGGLYVYLERPEYPGPGVPLELRGRIEDFVAAGNHNEAVFRRLWLDPSEFARASEQAREWWRLLGPGTRAKLRGFLSARPPQPTTCGIGGPESWAKRFASCDGQRTHSTWVRRALVDLMPATRSVPVVWLEYDGARVGPEGRRRIEHRSIIEHERRWNRREPDSVA